MTKPHEETWTVREDGGSGYLREVYLVTPAEHEYLFGSIEYGPPSDPSTDRNSNADDVARARLAAGAPAMARLLLEWKTEGNLKSEDVERVLRAAGVLA